MIILLLKLIHIKPHFDEFENQSLDTNYCKTNPFKMFHYEQNKQIFTQSDLCIEMSSTFFFRQTPSIQAQANMRILNEIFTLNHKYFR